MNMFWGVIVDANPDVIRDMSFILHGDYSHYQELKRLKTPELKEKHRLKSLLHFVESRYGGLISQYRMSSGECLLVSLLNFIHNVVIRNRSFSQDRPILMLLDEIEISLEKAFLPIASVEKFLYSVLYESSNPQLKRVIGDKYFQRESIDGLIVKYNEKYPKKSTKLTKKSKDFYDILVDDLSSRRISEELFLDKLCGDILQHVNYQSFEANLKTICVFHVIAIKHNIKFARFVYTVQA